MSDEDEVVVIRPEARISNVPQTASSVPEVEAGIISMCESATYSVTTLSRCTRRYNRVAGHHGTSVREIADSMFARGLIGIRYVEKLDRTFIMTAEMYEGYLKDIAAGKSSWDSMAYMFEDLK